MSSKSSVSLWLQRLKGGDSQAASELWQRYFRDLVRLARRKLRSAPRQLADEDDVALSAFKSLCLGAARGRFDQVRNRDELWRLLVVITARKAVAHQRHESRLKRGAGKRQGELALGEPGGGLEQVVGREPTPTFAAQMAEEFARLMECLGDETLRQIAGWKMEGYTNEEIAERLGCVERTVQRKLERIRSKWERETTG